MRDFAGQDVWLVGGSTGIGLALANGFAEEGANVLLLARREHVLRRAVDEVRSHAREGAQHLRWARMDVTRREQVERVLGDAARENGPPAVLVNCAGRARPRRFEEVDFAQLEETFRLHVFGPWATTSFVVPLMKKRGGGHILNVSSLLGLIAVYGYADYCASKFALVGLSEVLRSELGWYGIGVSVLCPPDTDTPGFLEENRTKPSVTRAVSGATHVLRADEVARAAIAGIRRNRFLIVPGLDGRVAFAAKRFAPRLVEIVCDRRARRAAPAGV